MVNTPKVVKKVVELVKDIEKEQKRKAKETKDLQVIALSLCVYVAHLSKCPVTPCTCGLDEVIGKLLASCNTA